MSLPPPDKPPQRSGASAREKGRALLGMGHKTIGRAKASPVGTLWTRLNAVDFINSAFQFATYGLLCVFPFMIVVTAAAGGSYRKVIITRLGLNPQAAKDVDGLIASGSQALASLTVLGIVFLVLSAIGIATNLQAWYQKVYDRRPRPGNWLRPLVSRLVWVAGLLASLWLQVEVGQQVGPAGHHVLILAALFVIDVLFWWWTAHILLLGKLSWRALFPAGLATALCDVGLGVYSSIAFSKSIISDDKRYGSVGVVMVMVTYFIAIGVVVHLGAVIGRMWNERHPAADQATVSPQSELPDRPEKIDPIR
jgi:membrane protein